MTTISTAGVVVLGAGPTGLVSAIILARAGHRVTVIERDGATAPTSAERAWSGWTRPGVPQFRQPHVLLPRWSHEVSAACPELLEALADLGAPRMNLLHLQPESVTGGWRAGDERFDTVAVRRPVLELALHRVAVDTPRLRIVRGLRVNGLLTRQASGRPEISGIQSSRVDITADLVIDAAGRRSPIRRWLAALGVRPNETRGSGGFTYHVRHFVATNGRLPRPAGGMLTHLPALSVITVPGDNGTYSVVLVTATQDPAMRTLRDPEIWSAVARRTGVAAPWLDGGRATSDVQCWATGGDLAVDPETATDSETAAGAPGLVSVGDAWTTTDPILGRGATLGLLQACAVRDALATGPAGAAGLALHLQRTTADRIAGWVAASRHFVRHRLADMLATAGSQPSGSEDPAWAATSALLRGGRTDPVLARAASTVAGLLAPPTEVLAEPEVAQRLRPYVGGALTHPDDPTRADLLAAVGPKSAAG